MSKKIILVIIIIFLLSLGIYLGFLKKEKPELSLTQVSRGTVTQEVSETGQVKVGEEINLSFKNAGRIEKISVRVGELIKESQVLAGLDTQELKIQLEEAQANLSISQAKLDKLLAGASPEEIQIAKTKVSNAQISLDGAKKDLTDSYEDALLTLDDTYLKIDNALEIVKTIQRTYFTSYDQESIRVIESRDKIENNLSKVKVYLDLAKSNSQPESVETALAETKKSLEATFSGLTIVRQICEEPSYRDRVSSTNKTSLDNQRTNINTALTNITNSQQTISTNKLSLELSRGKLQLSQDELNLLIAKPRQEDIDLYQAQVNQAQTKIQLLENQLEDAVLKSPVSGQVKKISKKEGETVQPMRQDAVISLLPSLPFEIEADIYEEDVVKMDINNLVDISLVAFPGQVFQGKVISIEPAEKVIEGVVYYQVTIVFEKEPPQGLKPGMTADLIIKTVSKENVLIIPESSIQKKEGKSIIQVFKNGLISEREIEIGLRGSNELVEVISGLKEGEEVILTP